MTDKTHKKIVSIIVPIYNSEKYLKELLPQLEELSDIAELIFINDGSKDKIKYKSLHNYIKANYIYIDQKNAGLSAARNAGLKRASGEYIWFIDSDDLIDPTTARSIFRLLKEQRPEMVHFKLKNFIDGKTPIFPSKKAFTYEAESSSKLLAKLNAGRISDHSQTFITSKHIYIDNKIEFPHREFEDVATSYKLVKKVQEIIDVTSPYYYRLDRQGSITQKGKRSQINALNKVITEAKAHNNPELLFKIDRIKLATVINSNEFSAKDYQDIVKETKKVKYSDLTFVKNKIFKFLIDINLYEIFWKINKKIKSGSYS